MATDFLYDVGTNGFIATPFNLLSTELNGLTNAHTAVSSGSFSQTNSASAPIMGIVFVSGGAFTPAAGDSIWGWFLESDNGGTNYDKIVSNTQLARTPDFVIPFIASAYASGDRAWAQSRYITTPPFGTYEVAVYNNTVTLPASGNIIKALPAALRYN